jgi:hypothetical protein
MTITFSCSKKTEYTFVVKNTTNYTLNSVSLDWCNEDNKISVLPNSTSNKVTLTYNVKPLNLFASGSLCVTVTEYSNPLNTYSNNTGIAIERTILSKKNINTIEISENNQSTSNPFLIELK